MLRFRERFKKSTCTLWQFQVPSLCLMIELIFLHDFARSAKIKCGGFDWTKFHTFKHVHLSLISVVYLLYLIIIGTSLCACLCVNIWRITAILLAFYETKGILVILTSCAFSCVGGSHVDPTTLGQAWNARKSIFGGKMKPSWHLKGGTWRKGKD